MSWGPVLDHWFAITGVADLDRSCRLGEAALDSLQMLELRTIVEKSGISLSDDALSLLTISDLVTALDRHGPPAVAPPGYEAMSAGLSAPGRYLSSAQLPPDLNAAGCSLQTLEPADLDFLYALATGPATGYRWRYRGAFPPADQFRIDVWSGVLSQFVVWRGPEPARRAGLVVCYQADLVNGTGYVGSVFTPELQNQGIAASVTQCFMRYLFKVYPVSQNIPRGSGVQFRPICQRSRAAF